MSYSKVVITLIVSGEYYSIRGHYHIGITLLILHYKDRKAIYTSAKKYGYGVKSWESNWAVLSTFFKYPEEIRKLIYTTNSLLKVSIAVSGKLPDRNVSFLRMTLL